MTTTADRLAFIKRLLDSGISYDEVVTTVAHMWGITPRVAEQQMTAAGFSRAKFRKKKTTESKTDPSSSTTETQPEKSAEKPKRARPKSPIKWTDALDAALLAEWQAGVPVAKIAASMNGTENAIRARVRLLSARVRATTPRQSPQSPSGTHEAPRKHSHVRALGREFTRSYLSQFGLLGEYVVSRMDDKHHVRLRSQREEEPARTGQQRQQQSGTEITETIERLVATTQRGAAEIVRRVDLMSDRVGSALMGATAAARSLVRGSADSVKREHAADATGSKSSSISMGGLGLIGGAMALLASSTNAGASLTPPDQPLDENDKKAKERALRDAGREDKKDTASDGIMDLLVRDAKFKADKITFDADEIVGLGFAPDKHNGSKGGDGRGPSSSNTNASPPDAAPPTQAGGGGWWDRFKSAIGLGSQSDASPSGPMSGDGPSRPTSEKRTGAKAPALTDAFVDQLGKENVGDNAIKFKDARAVAASFIGQANQESGYDPYLSHDNHTGYGMFGHRNDRKTAMLDWLSKNGYTPDDPKKWAEGQARYSAHESLNNPRFRKLLERGANVTGQDIPGYAIDVRKTWEGPNPAMANDPRRVRGALDAYAPTPVETVTTPTPVETMRPPVREAIDNESINRVKDAKQDATPTVTTLPSESVSHEPVGKGTKREVVDPSGPTFGGGKAPVPGLDADVRAPWG